MKDFFKKLWAAIRKPVCYAAIILIVGLFLFCVIDAIVRCCHQQVFYGIVQLGWMLAAAPVAVITISMLWNDAKSK